MKKATKRNPDPIDQSEARIKKHMKKLNEDIVGVNKYKLSRLEKEIMNLFVKELPKLATMKEIQKEQGESFNPETLALWPSYIADQINNYYKNIKRAEIKDALDQELKTKSKLEKASYDKFQDLGRKIIDEYFECLVGNLENALQGDTASAVNSAIIQGHLRYIEAILNGKNLPEVKAEQETATKDQEHKKKFSLKGVQQFKLFNEYFIDRDESNFSFGLDRKIPDYMLKAIHERFGELTSANVSRYTPDETNLRFLSYCYCESLIKYQTWLVKLQSNSKKSAAKKKVAKEIKPFELFGKSKADLAINSTKLERIFQKLNQTKKRTGESIYLGKGTTKEMFCYTFGGAISKGTTLRGKFVWFADIKSLMMLIHFMEQGNFNSTANIDGYIIKADQFKRYDIIQSFILNKRLMPVKRDSARTNFYKAVAEFAEKPEHLNLINLLSEFAQ
jgi:hypothetical protein